MCRRKRRKDGGGGCAALPIYGQRVEKSVFECKVDATNYAVMEQRFLEEINFEEDNLRFYRLTEPLNEHVKEF